MEDDEDWMTIIMEKMDTMGINEMDEAMEFATLNRTWTRELLPKLIRRSMNMEMDISDTVAQLLFLTMVEDEVAEAEFDWFLSDDRLNYHVRDGTLFTKEVFNACLRKGEENTNLFEWLVRRGMFRGRYDRNNSTLAECIKRDHAVHARLLLKHGCPLLKADVRGITAVDLAFVWCEDLRPYILRFFVTHAMWKKCGVTLPTDIVRLLCSFLV
jgi:hypothetical protein